MTERERLINLLKSARDKYFYTEDRADYMLENGVIVPPCKMGDMVYSFDNYFGKILPFFVEEFHICYGTKTTYLTYIANYYEFESNEPLTRIYFDTDDVGKTVFLTREEAEKALNGCEM